jgi:dihydroorotase
MQTLIKNGWVIDPANMIDGSFDILISNGKIKSVLPHGKFSASKIKGAEMQKVVW